MPDTFGTASIFIFFILGAAFGSFLAWLARTLIDNPERRARSRCDQCRRPLTWWELIPVVSYIFLRGKCRSCLGTIEITDWSMELIGAALFGMGAWRFAAPRELIWWLLIATSTMLLFYVDLRWMIVPRAFAVVTAFIALFIQLEPNRIGWAVLTALLGALFYFVQFALSRGKWVGDGDVGLGFIIGAIVGMPFQLALTIFIAYVGGAVIAVGLIILGKKKLTDKLPMGAFLIPAMWIVMLFFAKTQVY